MPQHFKNATDVAAEANRLANSWSGRDRAIREGYDLIRLVNDLRQKNMESVISSDPRTGFNMARWLLRPKAHIFAVDTEGFTDDHRQNVGPIESFCNQELSKVERRGSGTLFSSYLDRTLGLMLATGWYATFSFPSRQGWVLQAWNPAGVFPEYDHNGDLVKVARRFTISGPQANEMVRVEGWNRPNRPWTGNVGVNLIWQMTGDGVMFTSSMGSVHTRPEFITPFDVIPVHVAPAAGLPDDGVITQQWKSEIGASLVASVIDISNNYNRMLTYMQQLLRDTANPRWVEKTRSGTVLDPDRLFERGATFSIEPGEDILPIPTPPLPAEMRGHNFDLRGMQQRALFSDTSFGSNVGAVSGFMMSQVTAASQQVLDPFHTAIKSLLGKMATLNIHHMRKFGMDLGTTPFPSLPDRLPIDFNYEIEIPGDFMQRATAARTMNPDFRISEATIMRFMFPEIQDILLEKGRILAEDAARNPIFKTVLSVNEMQMAAREARQNNDEQFAVMLERAAAFLESQIGPQEQPTPANGQTSTLPPELLALSEGR